MKPVVCKEISYTIDHVRCLAECYKSNDGILSAAIETAMSFPLFSLGERAKRGLWAIEILRMLEKVQHIDNGSRDIWVVKDASFNPEDVILEALR